ncbi:hypothetical protein BDZ94DRAFT_1310772 [Collybia nuda]|uniref:Hydrophobin n=1 Tax=Collybia nuda TaxID=64659 RepID=A0A9P5Y2Q2_9AGAR|nr:hypothetical protein BDZ94DRAFT_1310772 [Collybia nuda]
MKFTSVSALSMLALPILAAATTTPTTPASECNVSNLKCCNSTQESDALTGPVTTILGLLGISLSDLKISKMKTKSYKITRCHLPKLPSGLRIHTLRDRKW